MRYMNTKLPGQFSIREAVPWSELALIRFVLASLVILYHLNVFYGFGGVVIGNLAQFGGKAAVIAFLYLSGFSIAGTLVARPEGFFRRRLYRIYPSYFVALLLTSILVWVVPQGLKISGRTILPSTAIELAGNFLFLQTLLVSAVTYNVAVWSLAVEMYFYALAPLLTRGWWLWGARLLVVISMISFVCTSGPEHGVVYNVFSRVKILKYYWCWHLGFEAYFSTDRIWWYISGLLGAVLALASAETPEFGASILIFAVFFATPALPGNGLVPIWLRPSLDYMGDLSYPLYLFHLPILGFLWWNGLNELQIFFMAILLVSVISVEIIEKRIKPHAIAPWLLRHDNEAIRRNSR